MFFVTSFWHIKFGYSHDLTYLCNHNSTFKTIDKNEEDFFDNLYGFPVLAATAQENPYIVKTRGAEIIEPLIWN